MPAPEMGRQKKGGYIGFVSLDSVFSNVRFGSLAAIKDDISLTAGSGGKAVIRTDRYLALFCALPKQQCNVRFHRYRTFDPVKYCYFEGPLTAKSSHSSRLCYGVREFRYPRFLAAQKDFLNRHGKYVGNTKRAR